MMRTLSDFLLFFRRDLRIASSYRGPFVLELVEALFSATTFYYVARFVDSPELRQSLPQGTSYFAYTLVGFAFFDYLHAALDTFDRTLEEARDTGTLEPLLVTQTSMPVLLVGSSMYPFALTTVRIGIYLAWGSLLFGFPLGSANWLSVAVVLIATVLSFSSLGIFSSAYLLLFKKGNPSKWFFLGISSIAGGMLFPVSILPNWLQIVARLNPVTYALDAMRAALLEGATLATIATPLLILLLFAAILLPASSLAFGWALHRTKVTGTLSHR
jgi:ABC-2 type transport system permease protein